MKTFTLTNLSLQTRPMHTAPQIKLTLLTAAILSITSYSTTISAAPDLTKAERYQKGLDVSLYWYSEKLDGIRAYWDGTKLMTRSGKRIYPPRWFINVLPNISLEGELWAGRGLFHVVQQTVLDLTPTDAAWKKIQFMLFDMPKQRGDYRKRYYNLEYLVEDINATHIQLVEHHDISSEQALYERLDSLTEENAEGIMLRKIASSYTAGRSNTLLKLKHHSDAEAVVIGYKLGRGRYAGEIGSLLVETEDGVQFYVGSGLSDELRRSPPPLGATITYRYNGMTHKGKPKFARLLRERIEE